MSLLVSKKYFERLFFGLGNINWNKKIKSSLAHGNKDIVGIYLYCPRYFTIADLPVQY